MTDYGLLLSPLAYRAEIIRQDAYDLRRLVIPVNAFPAWETVTEVSLEMAEDALLLALEAVREKRAAIAQMEREVA
jgi:hypothetical protein